MGGAKRVHSCLGLLAWQACFCLLYSLCPLTPLKTLVFEFNCQNFEFYIQEEWQVVFRGFEGSCQGNTSA